MAQVQRLLAPHQSGASTRVARPESLLGCGVACSACDPAPLLEMQLSRAPEWGKTLYYLRAKGARQHMSLVEYTHINVALLGFSLLLLVMLILSMSRKNPSPKRVILLTAMYEHLIVVLSALMTWLLNRQPGELTHALVAGGATLASSFCSLTCFTIMIYVYADASDDPRESIMSSRVVQVLSLLNAVNIAILLSNPFTHAYFYFSEGNTFAYGPLTWVFNALLAGQGALIIPVVLHLRKRNGASLTARLVACGMLVLLAALFRIVNPRLMVLYSVMTIVLATLCVGVQANLEEELAEARASAAESRVRLLSGQIHPHFVFNSLNVIKALVVEDPNRAEQAIQDFSDYLRSHLDEMSSTRMEPFAQEMEHVRHYISLEMADMTRPLEVRYDLQVEDFMLPPLTLQPLVENAIRHGIRTREEGGTVTISTWMDGQEVLVSVVDDGRGISSATKRQDQRRSVGLDNVRERLALQCAGTLEVTSGSQGTSAVMRLPEEAVR